MSLGEVKTEVEQQLGLLLEIIEFQSGHGGFGVGSAPGIELSSGGHIRVVVGINQIELLFFLLAREDGQSLVYPAVQIGAGDTEIDPIVSVMVDTVAEDEIV